MTILKQNERLLNLFPQRRNGFKVKSKDSPSWKYEYLMGQEGVTLSDFRLQGYVRIDNEVFEAETRRSSLLKGTPVKIIGVAFGRLVVERLDT
ncbi:MAG: NfeD family protein [Bacteroidota bacterium]